jgi:hypothetical protein
MRTNMTSQGFGWRKQGNLPSGWEGTPVESDGALGCHWHFWRRQLVPKLQGLCIPENASNTKQRETETSGMTIDQISQLPFRI